MGLKQFTEKIVVSDKLTAGNFAPAKGTSASELIITDHLPDELPLDATPVSDAVSSDAVAVDEPMLMAKADIELSPVSESAGTVASDADFAYTDHIVSDVAEFAADQPELVAMNTVQHIVDSTVLPTGTGSGISWGWIGAGAVAGGVGGYLLALEHGDSAGPAAPAVETVHVVVEREGAFIDTANYGVRDAGENTTAEFGVGGNADLEGKTVFVHFNDVIDSDPAKAVLGAAQGPLDFSGFGTDDKVEIDVSGFLHDVWHTSYGLKFFTDLDPEDVLVRGIPSHDASNWQRSFPTSGMKTFSKLGGDTNNRWGFKSNDEHSLYISIEWSAYGYGGNGYGLKDTAYQREFHVSQLGTKLVTNSGGDILAVNLPINLGNNDGAQVEFVNLPVIVGINQNGAWYDVNDNGIRDAGELTGITDVDATNNTVVFHVYDVPMDAVEEVPAPIDVKGFGLDDRILIDADTLHYNGFADFDLFTNAVASHAPPPIPLGSDWMASRLYDDFSGDGYQMAGVTLKYNTALNTTTGSVMLKTGGLTPASRILIIKSFSNSFFDGLHRFHEVVDFINPVPISQGGN